jgi:uncharacterized protein
MFDALADLVVYRGLGLDPASHAGAALHFFVMDTAKIFFLLVVIIYVMGLFRALLSPEKVRDYVRGKPKWPLYAGVLATAFILVGWGFNILTH